MQPVDQQFIARLAVATRGKGFVDITRDVAATLREHRAGDGLLTVFIRHTSASLLIQENADPDVRADLLDAFEALAPTGALYRHTVEGPDDMPAHIRTVLTGVSLAIPCERGRMLLGTWQGIYVAEHRTAPHRREIVLQFAGSARDPS